MSDNKFSEMVQKDEKKEKEQLEPVDAKIAAPIPSQENVKTVELREAVPHHRLETTQPYHPSKGGKCTLKESIEKKPDETGNKAMIEKKLEEDTAGTVQEVEKQEAPGRVGKVRQIIKKFGGPFTSSKKDIELGEGPMDHQPGQSSGDGNPAQFSDESAPGVAKANKQ